MPALWCSQGLWLPSFASTVGDGAVTRVMNAGARDTNPIDVDLIRALSDIARITRKPGQKLETRLSELRRECAT
jgi:hypothetical protein